MQADPIRLNANLGHYTNFMNLLDLGATAVPAGFQNDGLPFGVTLIAPPRQDGPLLHLASSMQHALGGKLGASAHPLPPAESLNLLPDGEVRVAVVGAHLSGLPRPVLAVFVYSHGVHAGSAFDSEQSQA